MSLKMRTRLRLLAVLASVSTLFIAVSEPSSAQSPPPGGGSLNCSVYQNIYSGTGGMHLEQHTYPCGSPPAIIANVYLTFGRDSTTLKTLNLHCQTSGGGSPMSTCYHDYVYTYADPRGTQTWVVCAKANWVGIAGTIATYTNCTRVKH